MQNDRGYAFHVFISHASEDKDDFVRPLANALRETGLQVWYDEFELKLGASIPGEIDKGINKSGFGVIVLSPAFIKKEWSILELQSFQALKPAGNNILPIWHNIDLDAVRQFSPSMSRLRSVKSSEGIPKITDEIIRAIGPEEMEKALADAKRKTKAKIACIMEAMPFKYFYRAPNIPLYLKRRAASYCGVPDAQSIIALIDCSDFIYPFPYFRGHQGFVFTKEGFYHYHERTSYYSPYNRLDNFTVSLQYESHAISFLSTLKLNCIKTPNGEFIYEVATFSPDPARIVALLNAISVAGNEAAPSR